MDPSIELVYRPRAVVVGTTSVQPAPCRRCGGKAAAVPPSSSAKLAALVALFAAVPASIARADGAVMVSGHVSARERELIVDAVREEGTALGLRFSSWIFGRDAVDAAVACLADQAPWSCVAPRIPGKDQVVIVEVDSDRRVGAPMMAVTTHLLTASAEGDSFTNRHCAMCNEEALRRTVGDLSRTLLRRAAERTGRTQLIVHSRPGGAQLTVDGTVVGSVNRTMVTFPGKHTLTLQLPGYAPATQEVVAIDGRTTSVSVDLHRAAGGAGDPGDRSLVLPGLAIGVGGAAIAAGGLLILFDEDPDSRRPQQPPYHDTAACGVVSLAAGVVVAGAGIYFLTRPRATSIATLAPLPGGAAVGWAARF